MDVPAPPHSLVPHMVVPARGHAFPAFRSFPPYLKKEPKFLASTRSMISTVKGEKKESQKPYKGSTYDRFDSLYKIYKYDTPEDFFNQEFMGTKDMLSSDAQYFDSETLLGWMTGLFYAGPVLGAYDAAKQLMKTRHAYYRVFCLIALAGKAYYEQPGEEAEKAHKKAVEAAHALGFDVCSVKDYVKECHHGNPDHTYRTRLSNKYHYHTCKTMYCEECDRCEFCNKLTKLNNYFFEYRFPFDFTRFLMYIPVCMY